MTNTSIDEQAITDAIAVLQRREVLRAYAA
jgi:hypothetical protein